MDRRNFLKGLGVLAAEKAFGQSQSPEKKEYPENVIRVKKPEGVYRLVLSSDHLKQDSFETVKGSDAVILEGSAFYGVNDYIQSFENIESDRNAESEQYRAVIRWAKETSTPVYFAGIEDEKIEKFAVFKNILASVEAGVGVALLANLGLNMKNKKLNKRDLLKGAGAAYLTSQKAEEVLIMSAKNPNPEYSTGAKLAEKLDQLNEVVHPELRTIVITLRNYIYAQKWKTVMQMSKAEKGGKPEVSLTVGSGHIGIKNLLEKSDEELNKIIDKISALPFLKEERSAIANIIRIQYKKELGRWVGEIHKDPALSKLENN